MFATVNLFRVRFEKYFNCCVKAFFPAVEGVQFDVISIAYYSEFFTGFGYIYGTLINITNKVFLNAKENVQ
jgi:hypothetical protein